MNAPPVARAEDTACTACGRWGAYAFETEALCVDCLHQRGSCCADPGDCDVTAAETPQAAETISLAIAGSLTAADAAARAAELHRVNPNCCYQACPRCSSMRRLREFRARHPDDWAQRLRGLPRIVALARDRAC